MPRAAWAIGASLLAWLIMFLTRRLLHRRDRVLHSPETARWQADAIDAVPLAWLFAAREVLRAVIGREPPLVLHLAAAIGVAVALWVVLRLVRRGRQPSPQP